MRSAISAAAIFVIVSSPILGDVPFSVGERLLYEGRVLGIMVGTVEGIVQEITEIDGERVYHVVTYTRSSKWVKDVFGYIMDDVIHAYLSVDTLLPVKVERFIREGTFRTHILITIDQVSGRGKWWEQRYDYKNVSGEDKWTPRKPEEKEIHLNPGTTDMVSLGYYVRALKLKPKTTFEISVLDKDKSRLLKPEVARFEKVGVPLGKFDSILVREEEYNVWLWLAKDDSRTLLKSEVTALKLGPFRVNLVASLIERG
ncbi:MAG: DUF3108 domain-containing protein [bacterium]